MKKYKQYFTPVDLAELMVNIVPEDNVNTIIDLSMGECGLLEVAKKRWNNASFFGADIDETLLNKIHERSPYIQTFTGDSLGDTINSWIGYQDILKNGKFDLVLANPPFNYFDQEPAQVDGVDMFLPIEIRFLLKYIDIIREGGYISIILPYGFLSLDLYNKLRMQILQKVTIYKVIKIFKSCFDRIDADTCLLLLQKKHFNDKYIQKEITIEYLDDQYSLKKNASVCITPEKNRLDLEYHQLQQEFRKYIEICKYPMYSLNKYVVSCKRGKTLAKKKNLVVDKGIRFLHTTDVKYLNISNHSPTYVSRTSDYFKESIVRPKNILVGRVGKACIGKIAIIPEKYPKAFISDCIFGLDIKDIDPYYLTLYLATKYGQIQLKGIAKGSCSKYITKSDLMNLMIIVPDIDIQIYIKKRYLDIQSRQGRLKKEWLLNELISELENILGKG